ncbi:SPOSA6832_04054, partial [Sporobolomyces salmonicolor]
MPSWFSLIGCRSGDAADEPSPPPAAAAPSPPSTSSPSAQALPAAPCPSPSAPLVRADPVMAPAAPQSAEGASSSNATSAPAFDPKEVTVIFVLGGPGAGSSFPSPLPRQPEFTRAHRARFCRSRSSVRSFVRPARPPSAYTRSTRQGHPMRPSRQGLQLSGDLLRAEQARPDSQYGAMIKDYIKEGKIVPMEVTIKLLENAMREAMSSEQGEAKEAGKDGVKGMPARRFLIDGFPRQMDQAVKFDESVRCAAVPWLPSCPRFRPPASRTPPVLRAFLAPPSPTKLTRATKPSQVCPSSLVLFLICPENILLERLLERGKTSGRDDDNAESIKKRFQTFINTSMPVVDYYRQQGKVVDIDSSKSIDDVYADIAARIEPVLASK